jgi:PTS system nitrogen regulatory IIA component
METLLTSVDVSKRLGIHVVTLERMARAGEIPAIKVGRLWRYRESDLDRWLEESVISSHHPCRERGKDKKNAFAAKVPAGVSEQKKAHPWN